jgi:hypothetical protein
MAVAPWGGQAASAASAAASDNFSWSIVSLGNDYVTQGNDFFFNQTNATVTAQGTSLLDIDVQQSDIVHFHLQVGSPVNSGEPLTVGAYNHASSYNPTSTPEPYINFFGEGRGGGTSGRFRIRQIDTDHSGNVTTLWLTFETDDGVLGDIRIGIPPNAAVVGPRDMLWPETEIDTPPPAASLTAWNPGPDPVHFDQASIVGSNAADDSIVSDGCSGQTLASGDTCHIKVRFRPLAVGVSAAELLLPEGGGGADHVVSLEGFVRATTTEFSLQSDPGDEIGQGQTFDFTPSDSSFGPQPFYREDLLQVDFGGGASHTNWVATFEAPDGQSLTPGTTYSTGDGSYLSVSGNSHGCNGYSGTFTVNDFELDPWKNVVSFSIDFTQWCGTSSGPGPALHGSLDYQVNGIAIRHTKTNVFVSGQVAKGTRNQRVDVQVARGSRLIAHKLLKLGRRGVYVLKLGRHQKATCTANAQTPSTPATVAKQVSKQGRC